MEKIKGNLPFIILTAVELILGLFILISHELFTRITVILFGVLLMVIGVLFLVRSLSDKEKGYMNWIAMAVSVIACVVGVFCTFFSGKLMAVTSIIAVIFGIMFIITAIFKLKSYLDASRQGLSPSPLVLISAGIAFVLGAIIVFNPFREELNGLCIFTGIALIVQAVIDAALMVIRARMES